MKLHFFLFFCACAGVLGLASCTMMDSGSGGTQVNEPTVDEMAALERQWGVTPRAPVPQRFAAPPEGTVPVPLQQQTGIPPAPIPAQLPEGNPSPPVQPPAPPPAPETVVTPAVTPGVTPAQIQKLKN